MNQLKFDLKVKPDNPLNNNNNFNFLNIKLLIGNFIIIRVII